MSSKDKKGKNAKASQKIGKTKPVNSETAPIIIEAALKVTESAPKITEAVPKVNETASKITEAVPKLNEAASKITEAVPKVNEAASKITETAPKSTEPAPKVAEPSPKAKQAAPKTKEPASKTKGLAQKATEPAPKAKELAPKPTEPAPKPTEPAPKATEPAPKATEPAPKATGPAPKASEPNSKATEIAEAPNMEDDDIIDVDLSAVEIASSLIDETFSLDDPQIIISDNMNEAYKNIMSVCSTTAHSIKQTINDVLNSRERVVITEVDPTTELQESLNQKIADFAKVVSGSFTPKEPGVESSAEVQSETEAPSAETVKPESKESSPESSVESKSSGVSKDAKSEEKKTEPNSEIFSQDAKSVSQPQSSNSLKNAAPLEEEKLSKKQKNGATKKKGDKTLDQVFKTLGNGSTDEKLHVLGKKYMETLEELRIVEPKLKQLERQVVAQQRDKEQLQAEHNRMILAKSRLEGLCREMQRQSKTVKEESLLRIKEEEEKRKEIANKFQATLNDISSLMQENSKNNSQLREENAELATKLKSLVDNYEVWEQNVTKVVQQKELEAQLAKAKHAKVNLLLKQETEKFLREKQSLLENLSELQKRCALLTTNELQLRTELADYTSKYEEFQSVLTNSSKVFATFKTDMESTSKKIKKLEKETNVYKQKWESSNNALLDMISHKEKQDKEFANKQQRIATLEKLCRALQAERNELRNQLNVATSNSDSPTSQEVPSTATEAGVA